MVIGPDGKLGARYRVTCISCGWTQVFRIHRVKILASISCSNCGMPTSCAKIAAEPDHGILDDTQPGDGRSEKGQAT